MELIWDPLRKREVTATPEERVRQWFIVQLRDAFGVPEHMMRSEVGFRFGGKPYRADILVYGRDAAPLLVVECKRPDVALTPAVLEQAIPALGCKLAGFDAPDAVLTTPETRFSSPLRLPRDEGCSSAVEGLYPCGEGAGYAGGITSAAVDGMRCAEAVLKRLSGQTEAPVL